MKRLILLCMIALATTLAPVYASINPNEVIVVYNSAYDWNIGSRQSKAVADYYCAMRNIPESNKCGLYVDTTSASISPEWFLKYIVNDYDGHTGLKTFLQQRFGFDPNNPATDSAKCLVLCYGVPMRVGGNERSCSVDSALTLLFNSTAWGYEPMASYGVGAFWNPYYSISGPDPANRTMPVDFGSFREANTGITVSAPNFTIVRMLDATHALAAGTKGVLYRGTLTSGTWGWTAIDDLTKQFISHDVTDICVPDPSLYPGCAFVCDKDSGTVIKTTNYGASWSTVVIGTISGYSDSTFAVSFYDNSNGWRVGSYYDSNRNMHYFVKRIPDTLPNVKEGLWGDLPSDFVPASIAAINGSEAWISGSGGIYHTTNSGASWTPQYTGRTTDVWVKEISGVKKGWAVTFNGKVLRTTDGDTWNQLTSPTFTGTADLAVYDDDHVAIAHGSGSFLLWNGSSWTTNSSDSSVGKCSVAWAGGNDVVACKSGTSVMRWRHDSAWNSTSPIPNSTWKMRYVTSRLDAYEYPLETVTINGEQKQIPRDVKRMIDRAVNADAIGRAGLIGTQPNGENDGRFVIDDAPPAAVSRVFSGNLEICLNKLIGEQNVHREGSSDPYTNTFAKGLENVMGYSSSGSYDGSADSTTTWWRPFNTWKDGAIGIFWNVSTDGRNLRSPSFERLGRDTPTQAQANQVLVHDFPSATAYNNHRVGLYATGNETPFATATFNNGTALIDLSGLTIPDNTTIKLLFPTNDGGMHDGEVIYSLDQITHIRDEIAAGRGVSYKCSRNQCLTIDLIREGCSAIAGNVSEPLAGYTPDPEVILPLYATGNTWAESAWMGMPCIPWMGVAVGDPLMSPYKMHPTVSLEIPSPDDENTVKGVVSLYATASPDTQGSGSIQRVDFWITSDQVCSRIGSDSQAPYECTWDTQKMSGGNRVYPDGDYTIQAVACESGSVTGMATVSRSVVLDSAGVPGVSISEPQAEDSIVSELSPVVAQPSGAPSSVEFWLFGNGNPILAGTAWTIPHECAISSAVATNGVYELQAIAYYGTTPASASYSALRRIVLVTDITACTAVGSLGSFDEETELMLVGVPVVAGASATMGGALYVEDPNRVAGIRVTTQSSVATGRKVVVRGILNKNEAGVTERYIAASQIWDMGECEVPSPLGMPNKSLGGAAPIGTIGITGGVGLYNLGLLVRTCGRVTFVGEDFVYVDDGSGLQDGNSRLGPYKVSLDGGAIPDPVPHIPPMGVLVNCNSLEKPGIGDYVVVTGISSTRQIEENIVRYLRPRGQSDIAYERQYQRCAKSGDGDFHTPPPALTPIEAGGLVRLIDAYVWDNYGSDFGVLHSEEWLGYLMRFYSDIVANTQLEPDACVTITGVAQADEFGTYYVVADGVYLGGSEYGALSLQPPGTFSAASKNERGGGPFRPWPGQTADEILASRSFRDLDNRPNCIGSALAQMDGTTVDLKAEIVCNEWYDGRSLGLKEPYEPMRVTPRLVLCLSESVPDIALWKQIDVVGGTLATLSNGQRAILYPQAVYLRTDRNGAPILMMPKRFDSDGQPEEWPWRSLLYSR